MAGIGYVCALVLAALFVQAAAAKLARPARTAEGFAALGLPAPRPLAWAVPGIELATAALLLAWPRAGGAASLAVLAVFTGVVASAVRRGVTAGCPCFGSVSTKPVSSADLVRNGALMLLAAAAILGSPPCR